MLNNLHIKNFTIIDEIEFELHAGMNALTGETGAGKSILIDAISLVLGQRTDAKLIGNFDKRCELFASFDLTDRPLVKQWLAEHELEQSNDCILRRVINQDGRSRCYINGKPSPLNQVRELGHQLLNIHGQHDQQLLSRPERQRHLLDRFANHLPLVQKMQQYYHDWQATAAKINVLTNQDNERLQRIEFITFQVTELQQLNLTSEELAALDKQQRRLASVEQIATLCQQALQHIDDTETNNCQAGLTQMRHCVEQITAIDETLKPTLALIDSARIQLQEAKYDLDRFNDGLELDPTHLQQVEQRLSKIHELARKHRIAPDQLPALQQRLESELKQLANQDEQVHDLMQQAATLKEQYHTAASSLSQRRARAAKKLIPLINKNLKTLDMPHCLFDIALQDLTDKLGASYGLEQVRFLIRPNPGQAFQPLADIASGGELSRISLAIQVVTAEKHATPTLIFDEVDTGISGKSADRVGRLLRQLGEKTQVLCITHLPQVASMSHNHLLISKLQLADRTQSQVRALDDAGRIEEIARLLGGIKITAKTRAHAKEMLGSQREEVSLDAPS